MAKEVPIFRPSLGEEELEALREVFESGWIGPGPRAERFEAEFAAYSEAPFAVSTTSGTAALHLALMALGVGPGEEVLVPTLTFVSTAHVARFCGARVVFVDVEPDSGLLDPRDLERRISQRSKAVIPVHYGGHPCRMEEIWGIAREHGLAVIEDAAHAAGARYKGRPVGADPRSFAACFSFNALKNLSTGDGGMIVTHSGKAAELARKLRWMGIEKSTYERTPGARGGQQGGEATYSWLYHVEHLGYKYIMNDIAAALGLVQLGKLERMQAARERMARSYHEALAGLDWLETPRPREDVRCSWHLYPVKTAFREAFIEHLKADGIATSVHYMPLHLQPYYRRIERVERPAAERLWRRLVSIPFHPGLPEEAIQRVIASARHFRPPETGREGTKEAHAASE